ncbi:MAG TPA: DNA methyltransferase, partial [Anaerolineales bacterium]
MTAPDIVKSLVERFEQHRDAYRSGRYNETQLRREFLDPFFEALGWDIFNKQSYAEMYKDVIHEDSLEIEGEKKAPDYAFRVGGTRKFFVEAKKPAVNIEMNIHPAFQLRRYAWSAKLPLGILTDFEEFAVYDCRVKPDKGDKASTGRVKLLSYKDYIEKWDEIATIFSREAVLKGSFDEYAEGMKTKKGTTEVDDAFLAEIERWRDLLARNIALRNPNLSVRELNYAVQMTIDRIVFLRICEDRGVERDEQLREIATPTQPPPNPQANEKLSTKTSSADLGEVSEGRRGSVYSALVQLFQRADMRYNSGLFHFKNEKDQSSGADTLTLSLKIDDKVLQDILKNLYYPESPYVFREIPSDILGQVYERFLGKVIRLTAGHQAKVEEKPEVRKAGGVFYTPTFIVENIIQNTVGKLLEGKTPKEVARLKFLDPACGSGTFPLGAFQYLLNWHLKWYLDHEPAKWMTGKNPAIYQSSRAERSASGDEAGRGTGGEWKLTTAKKKEILLNNIFGVDIDPQAVEVTKLSLLLKVLEGESNETIGSQLALFQERVLPDLGRNIKCGNSLIGYDYFEGRMFVEQEERERVNAFDWKAEFPQVFAQGGFDAVFGNPPYRMMQPHNTEKEILEYLRKKYLVAEYKMEMFHMFLQLGVSLLRPSGLHGFIVPATILNNVYAEKLRNWIMSKCIIR